MTPTVFTKYQMECLETSRAASMNSSMSVLGQESFISDSPYGSSDDFYKGYSTDPPSDQTPPPGDANKKIRFETETDSEDTSVYRPKRSAYCDQGMYYSARDPQHERKFKTEENLPTNHYYHTVSVTETSSMDSGEEGRELQKKLHRDRRKMRRDYVSTDSEEEARRAKEKAEKTKKKEAEEAKKRDEALLKDDEEMVEEFLDDRDQIQLKITKEEKEDLLDEDSEVKIEKVVEGKTKKTKKIPLENLDKLKKEIDEYVKAMEDQAKARADQGESDDSNDGLNDDHIMEKYYQKGKGMLYRELNTRRNELEVECFDLAEKVGKWSVAEGEDVTTRPSFAKNSLKLRQIEAKIKGLKLAKQERDVTTGNWNMEKTPSPWLTRPNLDTKEESPPTPSVQGPAKKLKPEVEAPEQGGNLRDRMKDFLAKKKPKITKGTAIIPESDPNKTQPIPDPGRQYSIMTLLKEMLQQVV